MTDEERALLAAILAEPDDDTPRLVYADWLDEHGRPERGELIRVQCWLVRTKGEAGAGKQRAEWTARLNDILQRHAPEWRKELPKVPGVQWGPFERGMIESISLTLWALGPAEDLLQLDKVFGHTPLRVARVNFSGGRVSPVVLCSHLLTWRGLERFHTIQITNQTSRYNQDTQAEFVRGLWRHGWAESPAVLDLRACRFGDDAARVFAEAPAGKRLPVLDLRGARLGPAVAELLTRRFAERVLL